jgi:hypothetical protein
MSQLHKPSTVKIDKEILSTYQKAQTLHNKTFGAMLRKQETQHQTL